MKFKKLTSLALSGALALSLAAPAFAASSDLQAGTDYEGSMKVPTIKITVPESGKVLVNPYKMSYTDPAGGAATTDQIVSPTNYIKNESDVALNVSATVTGTLPTGKKDVSFATASTQGGTKALTTNSIFMYFEIGAATADDGTGDPTWPESYVAKPAADADVQQILVAAKATTKANVLTLEAGDSTATYAAYRLTGDAVTAPTRAWADDDAVSVAVAFTFTPTAAAED